MALQSKLYKGVFLALTSILAPPWLRAQSVAVYVTSEAGDRLTARATARFGAARAGGPSFEINDAVRHQEMIGFGASFLEAGMICLRSLEPGKQEQVLQALFDPKKGAGYTAMKTVIGATDFMSAGPFYTLNDHAGDVGMKQFSIARDLQPNGLIPYIQRARRYGSFVLQAPMDYPPDWMLFDVDKNQDVNPKYFDALALYYLRYLEEYQKHGVFVDYLSLFNEPSIYTKIPPEKVRDLLKDHVGPLLEKKGITSRIQACETSSRDHAWRYWRTILDDPQARKYTGAIAYHAYGFKDFDRISELHRLYPDLKLWMTEICHATTTDSADYRLPRYDYADGDFWGNQIMNDLETGTSAWIYWNMILDEKGGPWLVSEVHHDPPYNAQQPVVVINRQTRQVTYLPVYYYLAHFSRFVRPGAVRIGCSGGSDGVRGMAFRGPDGTMVTEIINSRKQGATISVKWRGQFASVELPALSIATLTWK